MHLGKVYLNARAFFKEKLMFVKMESHIFNVKCWNLWKSELHSGKSMFMPAHEKKGNQLWINKDQKLYSVLLHVAFETFRSSNKRGLLLVCTYEPYFHQKKLPQKCEISKDSYYL